MGHVTFLDLLSLITVSGDSLASFTIDGYLWISARAELEAFVGVMTFDRVR